MHRHLTPNQECSACRKRFYGANPSKYCSDACRYPKRAKQTATHCYCGNPLVAKLYTLPKYCSRDCSNKRNKHEPLSVRFWRRVEKAGDDECWLWKGPTDPHGYGLLHDGKKNLRAHRCAWEIINGPVPKGMNARHTCDNTNCANPAHIILKPRKP